MDPLCIGEYPYYFINDVKVVEGFAPLDVPLELGDLVFECFSYEIDPDHEGHTFEWSDGSTGPTLNVTQTGVYVLTITDGCKGEIDSIEVTIGGNYPPVDLGPDDVTICPD